MTWDIEGNSTVYIWKVFTKSFSINDKIRVINEGMWEFQRKA